VKNLHDQSANLYLPTGGVPPASGVAAARTSTAKSPAIVEVFTDHTDIRPTLVSLAGLTDDYRGRKSLRIATHDLISDATTIDALDGRINDLTARRNAIAGDMIDRASARPARVPALASGPCISRSSCARALRRAHDILCAMSHLRSIARRPLRMSRSSAHTKTRH
jgi:hypothetical protein